MEIIEKITIEDEGEYIHIHGQMKLGRIKGKDIRGIVGIAKNDAKAGEMVEIEF